MAIGQPTSMRTAGAGDRDAVRGLPSLDAAHARIVSRWTWTCPSGGIELDADGTVTSVAFRDRLDAHRLIEEFMVLANVAAAEELMSRRAPLIFRVHEEPAPGKAGGAARGGTGRPGLVAGQGAGAEDRRT
jgi:hypothetical protein